MLLLFPFFLLLALLPMQFVVCRMGETNEIKKTQYICDLMPQNKNLYNGSQLVLMVARIKGQKVQIAHTPKIR